jgi:hypothetical protein
MDKYTQLQLVEEGFWDSFGRVARVGVALGKEVAKVVTPQTYQNTKNLVNNIRGVGRKTKTAYMTKEERILDWLDEMGFVPVLPTPTTNQTQTQTANQSTTTNQSVSANQSDIPPNNVKPRKIRDYGGGKSHWAIDVGVKGIDPKTGDVVIVRHFKEPAAIVQYDELADSKTDSYSIKFVLRPDRRRMYYDDDGTDNQQQTGNTSATTQQAGNQQAGNAPAATRTGNTSSTTQQTSNASAARKQPARKQPAKKRTSRTR